MRVGHHLRGLEASVSITQVKVMNIIVILEGITDNDSVDVDACTHMEYAIDELHTALEYLKEQENDN